MLKRFPSIPAAMGVLLLVSACATTTPRAGGGLPGLALAGTADNIVLRWSKDSPLARSLRSRESVSVVASYASEGGRVENERLGSAQVDTAQYGVVLKLPNRLQNVPAGPVCLRLVRNHRTVIPIRVAGPGYSTDRFRFPDWEPGVAARTEQANNEALIGERLRHRRLHETALDELQGWKMKEGISSRAQCLTLTSELDTARPQGAVSQGDRGREARKQCVAQFAWFAVVARLRNWSTLPAKDLAGRIAMMAAGQPEGGLGNQLAEDAVKYREALSISYEPRLKFNRDGAGLGITAATIDALDDKGIGPVVAAAIAEAYGVCLEEAESRFELAYDNWRRELQDSGDLLSRRTEALRSECSQVFENEAIAKTKIADIDRSIATARAKLSTISEAGAFPPQQTTSLIDYDCTR